MRSLFAAAFATLVCVGMGAAAEQPVPIPSPTPSPAIPTPADVARIPAAACDGGDGCNSCRFWGSAEYLLGWTRGQSLPPLVTTSTAGTPVAVAGALGQPTTTILFGGGHVNTKGRDGGRFELGYWLDDCRDVGIGGSFLVLREARNDFHAMSGGDPILARPIFDTVAQTQAAEVIAFPGIAAGCIDISTFSQFLGAEAFVRKKLWCNCKGQLDGLIGYRFLDLRDGVVIDELATQVGGGTDVTPTGAAFALTDSFITQNHFHGGMIGLMYHCCVGKFSLDVTGKVALGGTGQTTIIQGATRVSAGGVSADLPGGLLALGTNAGEYRNIAFSFVPELRLSLGYEFCCGVRAFISYDFLYWTNVVRAGEQIDLNVDPNNIPPAGGGGAQPAFRDQRNDFWLQGIGIGISCKY